MYIFWIPGLSAEGSAADTDPTLPFELGTPSAMDSLLDPSCPPNPPSHAPVEEKPLGEKTLEVPGKPVREENVAAKVEEISDEDEEQAPEPEPVQQPEPAQAVAPPAQAVPSEVPVVMPVAMAATAVPADFPPKRPLVDKNLGLGDIEQDLEKELAREMSKIGIPCPKDSTKAVDEALAAESVGLAEALPLGDKDLRKAQLAMKASNKEAAETKRKIQEEEKEAKKAAQAEKKWLREEKKAEKKAEKNIKKNQNESATPGEVPPAEAPADSERELAAEAEEVDVEDVVRAKKRKSRAKADAKAKGRPRNAPDAGPAAASGPSTGPADDVEPVQKRPRGTRRGGGSDAVDKVLVGEIFDFMRYFCKHTYDKDLHAVHKGVPGMTPYWSRKAAGIKLEKQDGGKFQACYFAMDLPKCCPMATNIFLAKKFQEQAAHEGIGWAESPAAGDHYGLLWRSAKAAHDKLK